jgi:hypothetical protein
VSWRYLHALNQIARKRHPLIISLVNGFNVYNTSKEDLEWLRRHQFITRLNEVTDKGRWLAAFLLAEEAEELLRKDREH